MFSIAYLWHILELGNCLGIRDEGKTSAALDHAANVRDACLLGQIAQDAEGNAARDDGRTGVHGGDDDNVTKGREG